jgi:SAM-dependent methyltransferase
MPDFTTVTEITGNKVTEEQIERMYTRYRFALDFCENKDVLEIACGSGQGLGLLAKKAHKVVGGDIDENNLKLAIEHYKNRSNIELKILDAHQLQFDNESFDVIILYEAIYYLREPASFVKEAWRVLRKGGVLLVCTANKDCPGFNPSPYSYRYLSAPELFNLLKENGFINIALFGDLLLRNENLQGEILSLIKRIAVRLHIIPKTMKGKEFLKRIFFGKLELLPPEI